METNEKTDPKVIKIDIEVVVEDDTPKVKYRNPWAVVALLSFIALCTSIFTGPVVFIISYTVFLVSVCLASDKAFDRENHPEKYRD